MKQFLMSMGLATLLIPMTTSASMINIGGAAKAFFPTQNVNMTLISEKIKHINYFDEKSHRDIFQKKYALESYKPDIMVVIGRSNCFKFL